MATRTAGYLFNFPATPVPSTLLRALHNLMCRVVDLPVPGLRAMSHFSNDSTATWMYHVLGPHTSGDECYLVHIGKIRYMKNIKNLPPGAMYSSACRPALPRCFESPG
jgi:hypothetical protein